MLAQTAFDFIEDNLITSSKKTLKARRTGTFTDNMSLPVHRWFRFSAGFSAEWVEKIIKEHNLCKADYVFDPFSGSGTTLLAAQKSGISTAGTEHHPFIYRIAKAKLSWHASEQDLFEAGISLLNIAKSKATHQSVTASLLLSKCYSSEALSKLEILRDVYLAQYSQLGTVSELLWLAITAILRECSAVGTAQWQYILPNKVKDRVRDPFDAFLIRIKMFCSDMLEIKRQKIPDKAILEFCDARDLASISHLNNKVKLVITSPPYPNNYDYADATRLEMTFWGEINGWGDLQKTVRHRLVRSCSQHSAAEKLSLTELLSSPLILPIKDELTIVCNELAKIRETKGGKKTYHTMVAAYFIDLAKTWHALKPLCTANADICFVIGDSAPYGVHVPVERWLGELSLAAGFKSYSFEKIRDRNIKWKNRKHRVPLKEGHLWVKN